MITTHPQFARATVNLIWGRLMTVGFVEPYDAFDMAQAHLARIRSRATPSCSKRWPRTSPPAASA